MSLREILINYNKLGSPADQPLRMGKAVHEQTSTGHGWLEYLGDFIRGRRGKGRWCDMAVSYTVIAIKFARAGEWEADEGSGVRSSFATKQQALDYGIQRIAFHRAELRIHGEDGTLERTIAFNEAGDLIPKH